MSKYKCDACGYKFKGDESRLEKACPYCGKQGSVTLQDSDDEFIKDVDKMF